MCKKYIEFLPKDGGVLVQAIDEIERIETEDECYLLRLFATEYRKWLPIKLALTEENLKAIRSLTEKHRCCCCRGNKES